MDIVSLTLRTAFDGAQAYAAASDHLRGLARDTTAAQAALKTLDAQAKDITRFRSLGEEVGASRTKLSELKAELDRVKGEMAAAAEPSAKLTAAVDRAGNAYEKAAAALAKKEQRLAALGGKLKEAGIDTERLAQEEERLARAQQAATAAAEKAQAALDAQAKKTAELERIDKTAAATLDRMSRLTVVAGGLDAVGQAADRAGLGVGALTDRAGAFERAMAEVSTLLDDTSGMDHLGEEVRRLNREFGGGAAEQAKALYQVISAGAADSATAMDTLTVANKLATGGVTDVLTAADGLTSALNAYGPAAGGAAAAADAFFVAVKKGKTTVPELAANIGTVSPVAAEAGVSLEQLLAAIAAITLTGARTPAAVTAIQAAIASVIKPSAEAQSLAAQLGISFDSTALKADGLAGFLGKVRDATGGSQEKLATLFGSVEAVRAVLALTGSQSKSFADAIQAMGDRAGATEVAFSKMEATRTEASARAKAAVEDLQITLGQSFAPTLVAVADGMGRFVDQHRTLAEVGAGSILTLAGLATAASLVMRAYTGAQTVWSLAAAALRRHQIEAAAAAGATDGVAGAAARARGAVALLGSALRALGWTAVAVEVAQVTANLVALYQETQKHKEIEASTQAIRQRSAEQLKEISERTGVVVRDMKEFDAAVAAGRLVWNEASHQWAAATENLKVLGARLVQTATQAEGSYKVLKAGIDLATTALERHGEVLRSQGDAVRAQSEARQALARLAGDEAAAMREAAAGAAAEAANRRELADQAVGLAVAKQGELQSLRDLVAAHPDLLVNYRSQISELEQTAAASQARAEAAKAEAEGAAVAAAGAELASRTYDNQSDHLEALQRAAAAAKTRIEELTAAQALGRAAGERLAQVDADLTQSAEAFALARAHGIEPTEAMVQANGQLRRQHADLQQVVDKGRAAEQQLAGARRELAVATAQVADAARDRQAAIERQMANADRELSLGETIIKNKIAEAERRKEAAQRRGDEADAARQQIAIEELELRGIQAARDAKLAEAEALRQKAEARRIEAEASHDDTAATKDAIDAMRDAAAQSEAEADGLRVAIQAKRDHIQATAEQAAKERELKEAAAAVCVEVGKAAEISKEAAAAAREAGNAALKQAQAEGDLAHAADRASFAASQAAESVRTAQLAAASFGVTIEGTGRTLSGLGEYADVARQKFDELVAANTAWGQAMQVSGAQAQTILNRLADQAIAAARAAQRQAELGDALGTLRDRLDAGEIGLDEYTRQLQHLQAAYQGLGEERLQPLRDALADAQRRTEALAASAQDTLDSIRDRLDQLHGDEVAKATRDRARDLADLQRQLNEAIAAGNAEAQGRLREAIRLAEQYWSEYIAGLQAADAAAGQSRLPGVGGHPPITYPAPGGGGPRNIGGPEPVAPPVQAPRGPETRAPAAYQSGAQAVPRVIRIELQERGRTIPVQTEEAHAEALVQYFERLQGAMS